MAERPVRVFISYSQYDPNDLKHADKVWALAHALANDGGLEVELDRFHGNEITDWPIWCQKQLEPEQSDYVLMVCTAEYYRRVENQAPADTGRGVWWEGEHIAKAIYRDKGNRRFVPVLLDDEPEDSIPRSVEGWTWFRLRGFGIKSGDQGYENLYRLLTQQPAYSKPDPKDKTVLPPEAVPSRQVEKGPITHNLPLSLGGYFKGRDEFLQELHEEFQSHPRQAIVPRQAIHGLGGIGKTRAAVEYAWRYRDDYKALFFLKAETSLELITSLAGLCPLLKLAEGVSDERQRAGEALGWLSRNTGWLLIVDNVDSKEAANAVKEWLGQLAGGNVLLTGRLRAWPRYVLAHRLDVLDEKSAAQFLLESTKDERQPRPDDGQKALELARELDGLALALEQAAAFINRHRLGFADYLRRWRQADQRTRRWHDSDNMDYPRPLATTWQASVELLPVPARTLLDVIAWLGSHPIPRFLFDYSYKPEGLPKPFNQEEGFPSRVLEELCRKSPLAPLYQGGKVDVEAAFADLRGFSLLQTAEEADFSSEGKLHRVLALITRERQEETKQVENLKSALALVNVAAVGNSTDVRTWPVWNPLEPLLRTVVDFAEAKGLAQPTDLLLNDLGLLLYTKALHQEAEPLYRRSLALAEQTYGPDHSEIAIRLNNLALLLKDTNRLGEAEPLMHRALEIDEASFGKDHPLVAIRLSNLAQLLQDTNRLGEAEPLMRQALEIDEASFGPDHPDVARDLNNLAGLLQDTNRLEEVEPLMRRVIEIFEQAYGKEHPNVATALNNFAQLLQATHRLEEAEPLMRRALAIDEESFGPEHPKVAIRLNNLAQLLKETHRLEEAEPLMRRSLSIFLLFTRNIGHVHPNLRATFGNYYELLQALQLERPALAERLLSLGPEAGFTKDEFAQLLAKLD